MCTIHKDLHPSLYVAQAKNYFLTKAAGKMKHLFYAKFTFSINGQHIGLTTLPPSVTRMSKNVGASTSHKPKDLHSLYRDNITVTLVPYFYR
jgi:hypothetical protein